MVIPDLFIHHLPQPFYRVQIRAVRWQVMKLNIHHISPVFHQPASVVTSSVKDKTGVSECSQQRGNLKDGGYILPQLLISKV